MNEMLELRRTTSENLDFIELVKHLDAYLTITDGEDHAFYDQYNGIDVLTHVIVAYDGESAVGCGAMKQFDNQSMEVKRMYTPPEYRGKGIAREILSSLEDWAKEQGYSKCILETGKRQIEAVAFYPKCGYQEIPNFGQYEGIENSVCFEKQL